MGLPSLIPALINHALLFTVVGNWSITTAEPPPAPPPAAPCTARLPPPSLLSPPSPFTQAQGYNAALTLSSDQCGGHRGGVGTHPLQLSFLSVATGHQHSIQSALYSPLRLYQGSPSTHTSPQPPNPDRTHPPPLHVHRSKWGNSVCFPQ